jgi:O-antigen/teichoic acid export membrane protein
MLQQIKRLTKHSAVYGVGHIVSRSVGFLLLPIHTNCIGPAQYGVANLLFATLAILNVVFSYGMDVAFLRFFILGGNETEKRRVFSTAHWTIFTTGIAFSAVMLAFPGFFSTLVFQSANHARLIRLAAGICLADALRLLPFLALRGEEKSVQFVILNSLNIVATVALNVLFVVKLRRGVEGIFVANLLGSVITLATVLPIFRKWLRFSFSTADLRELLKFGIPYVPSGMAVAVMEQISRFFIARKLGVAATGIFSASYKLGIFMSLIVAAFRFAWHPFFLSSSKEPGAPRVFARVLTYFTAVTAFFLLAVSLLLPEIASLHVGRVGLIGREYLSGLTIVPAVLLAYVLYGWYANFIVGVYLKKKTVWLPFITGSGLVAAVVANLLLIPPLGIAGAAWATCIGYGVMAAAMYVSEQRLYPIPYEFGRLAKLAAVTALVFWIGTGPASGWGVGIRVLCLASFVPLLMLVRFPRRGETAEFRRLAGRILAR